MDERPSDIGTNVTDRVLAEIARADCVIAELSHGDAAVLYAVGIAHAMAKPMFALLREDAMGAIPLDIRTTQIQVYAPTAPGREALGTSLSAYLREFREFPQRSQHVFGSHVSTPFFIDWDRLEPADAENLYRELLSQMGFRDIDWHKGSEEYDLIAELPRKDPDGFEYRDLWLVSIHPDQSIKALLDLASSKPDSFFFHRDFRDRQYVERVGPDSAENPPTLLFIVNQDDRHAKELEWARKRFYGRRRKSPHRFPLRVRFWDREYLTTLVQQFPQIGYKYFSEEARSLSKHRKGYEELYQENVVLSDRLAATIADLEEEKNRRIRAERDAVWKDISFAAAHKIGNPIFAIETDLDPLKKRITEKRTDEAVDVIGNIRGAVEKAKNIIDQFKSLTKAQDIHPEVMPLRPVLEGICTSIRNQEVDCTVECPEDLRVVGDVTRLTEVFDELTANSLHWCEGADKQIHVKAMVPEKSSLASLVDLDRNYALVHFADNGPGVQFDDKLSIFEAFITKYDQGTGLGLALVRRIIEGHGGAIQEVGIPGQGADFEIYLPLPEEETGDPKRSPRQRKMLT
ncbi:MAG: HAMP domain-containing histidine kinase [Planctomycetes bacterium]|nr:HAMP domain-containing histidine kinase [Planctomycetota bacterium]